MKQFHVSFHEKPDMVLDLSDQDDVGVIISHSPRYEEIDQPTVRLSASAYRCAGSVSEFEFWEGIALGLGETVQIKYIESTEQPTPSSSVIKQDGLAPACNFCGKMANEVKVVIAAEVLPAHICNECVDVCVNLVRERDAT